VGLVMFLLTTEKRSPLLLTKMEKMGCEAALTLVVDRFSLAAVGNDSRMP